jgi:MFS family permease
LPEKSRTPAALVPWLSLLVTCILICQIDRVNLAVAAPLLKDEFHLNPWQLGILFSAFFWTYSALQPLMGWLTDRFEVNLVLAAGFLLWSLATVATGFVSGFAMLLVTRLMLGIGESCAFPSSSKILARHVPECYRGFANGAVVNGTLCGPAVGSLVAGLLMTRYGWRMVFIVIGLFSLAWLPAWRKWMPRGQALSGSSEGRAPSITAILRQRAFWGASAGHFSVTYLLYLMLTWLPLYLVRERHLSMNATAKVAAAYFLFDAAAGIAVGWLSDSFIRRGYESTRVRKSVIAVGHTTAAIGIVACAVAGPHTYLVWLMAAAVGRGMANPGAFVIAQTLAGSQATGTWTGFQIFFANLSGVIAPALTGFLVSRSGTFLAAFEIAAAVSLAGGFAWVLAVGHIEPVNWAPKSLVLSTAAADSA